MIARRERHPRARLWIIYRGGWVKLTLSPGDTLRTFEVSDHDEGWSSIHEEYSLEGDVVTSYTFSDGVDCDGRLSSSSLHECEVSKLKSHTPYFDEDKAQGIMLPMWNETRSGQRDYAAEAMGY